ncbi:MarR family winged helix-turn-helix transcriptional regulator [Agromyces allii]|uniref:MarR family transcriptional regulator n=1 Tax=Agromyces allii TaxID=393607 RepID=A0ABN2QW39_9MICO|nr:MarR family transcriptional regulator [Agromyces allii]
MPANAPDLEATADALRVTIARLARRVRNEGGMQEFTPSQTAVVRLLSETDGGGATIAELARLENVRPQSMSATVAELRDAGIVDRRPDPTDGRAQLVFLTDAAQSAIQRARANKTGWFLNAMRERLSPAEQRTLAEAAQLFDRLLAP